ncbi:hypothetical protein [Bradyrhizobium sp. CCBAU 21365]|uniref:hypothetical protein n=1 Tax=Bradyrhizobium sp. CCBAU 21365 TaxID=1325083 RepID=UPI001889FB09|nr:hypothetical protein [Bradyrhizobium sp. CCBAU 21365]
MAFGRSHGRFMEGQPNHNIRTERDHDGQVVVERQTRSLWGTPFGVWERAVNTGNHEDARDFADEDQDDD